MRRVPAERRMRDTYELIGRPASMFDITLDPVVASDFRDYVAQEFFPRMSRLPKAQTRVTQLGQDHDRTISYVRFSPDSRSNPDSDLVTFAAASLSHYSNNAWRFVGMITRYNDTFTHNKIAVRHFISMTDDRLFEARREVRILRSNSDDIIAQEIFDNQSAAPDELIERIAFERPLTNENAASLQDHLQRVARRCIAIG